MLLLLLALVNKIWNNRFSGLFGFLVVFQAVLFFLALVTNDPVLPASWGIDPWWEWTFEGLVAAFAVWKAYLDPLKRKVYSLDREMGEVKTDITAMKIDINNIKNKIECLPRLEADMILIKEKILSK
jgi:hypothetical protein